MMNYFIKCMTDRRADCYSRARRREYWGYTLINLLLMLVVSIIGYIVFAVSGADTSKYVEILQSLVYPNIAVGVVAVVLYFIQMITVIPSLAAAVRRLHDINKSAWWLLLNFIPVVGWIWLIALYITPGDKGANKYGEDPKIAENTASFRSDFQCFNSCLTKYADFKGKCNMQEYWSFSFLEGEVLGFGGALGGLLDVIIGITNSTCAIVSVALLLIALIIPGLAATARRLRSAGYSPWWVLLIFIAVIGWIWLFVLCLMPDKEQQEGLL